MSAGRKERRGLSLGPPPTRRSERVDDPLTWPRPDIPPIPEHEHIPEDELLQLRLRVAGLESRAIELEGARDQMVPVVAQTWWNKLGNRALAVLWILQTLALAYFRGMP